MSRARMRLRFEVGLATLSAGLLIATLAWPEWIEIVFRAEPDHGDGSIEWLVTALMGMFAIVAVLLARAEWRRLRSSEGSAR